MQQYAKAKIKKGNSIIKRKYTDDDDNGIIVINVGSNNIK